MSYVDGKSALKSADLPVEIAGRTPLPVADITGCLLRSMTVGTAGSRETLEQWLFAMRYMKPASVGVLIPCFVLLSTVGGFGIVPRTAIAAGPTKPSDASSEAGFRWLVSQQKNDGSWDLNRGTNPSSISAPTVGTALAILPMLGADKTTVKGVHSKSIAKGLAFIQGRMKFDEHGCHSQDEAAHMYGHAIITMALSEAFARTRDRQLRVVAQGAVDFIVYSQDPNKGGWRYQPRTPGDTSVTGWQLQALATASTAGLRVPEQTIDLASKFLDSTQADGGVSYAYTPEGNASPTMSVVGLFSRTRMRDKANEHQFMKGLEDAAAHGPTGISKSNIYYDYYGTLLMKVAGGPKSRTWGEAIRSKLAKSQETPGDDAGSWFFEDAWSQHLGRLGMTSFSLLILNHTAAE